MPVSWYEQQAIWQTPLLGPQAYCQRVTDFMQLVQAWQPGATFLRAWPLTGGVSAVVTALEYEQAGQLERVVVRQYGSRDLSRNPQIAEAEFKLLHGLHTAGLPVPQPLHHESGVLVIDFIDGASGVDTAPDPAQLAQFLACLHALDASKLAVRPLPDVGPAPVKPDDSLSEKKIRALLARHPPQASKPVLLHGDFWPGNTLWHAGNLAAVIDWEDTALGEALYDVGIARLELLFFYGQDAMQAFTGEYQRLTTADFAALPHWDLRAALRPCGFLGYWGHSPELEAQMRVRHAWFVGQAISQL